MVGGGWLLLSGSGFVIVVDCGGGGGGGFNLVGESCRFCIYLFVFIIGVY